MPEVPNEETPPIDDKTVQAVQNNEPLPGTEKFWDEEKGGYNSDSLAKSYAELSKKLGKPQEPGTLTIEPGEPEENQETSAPNAAAEDQDDTQDTTAEDVVENAGLDMGELQKAYRETGEIPAEAKEKILEQLKPLGVGESELNTYLKAQVAAETEATERILGLAGGSEGYAERLEWAKASMSPQEIQAFNAAVTSGDVAQAELAVRGLDSRYREANGSPPASRVGGRKAAASSVKPFASQAEATRAVQNPKYASDPAYRAQVEARMAAALR